MSKDKDSFLKIIKETTNTGGSGSYRPPISPGLKLWDKSSLGPFTDPVSNYVSSELQYDSYDGIIDSKDIKTKEHKARKISQELKRKQQNQDDDGLGAGRLSGTGIGGDISEQLEKIQKILAEDLAVWFGTKKKPKGSKQPKGPWVNICRKDKNGKHPPCGRSDTSKDAYPKCRAAGVAGKMTDSQKKSACAQKRRAEKKDTQTGKGQKPVYTSYKPKKESIIPKEVLLEKFKVEPHEYEKLYEDDNFLLVIPLTFEASCKYGAGTKWCTTSKDKDDMFEKHFKMGSLGYLIVKNKNLQDKLQSTKYGLFANRPNKNFLGGNYPAPQGIIVYDDKNNIIDNNKIINLFDRVDLYDTLRKIIRQFTLYSEDKFKKIN